jgi:putative ATPase
VYLAQAPKSNAVARAMGDVRQIVKHAPSLEVPNHLRNAPVKGMVQQGYGKGYAYPHDVEGALVQANYFPVGMPPRDLYDPSDRGRETEIRERMMRAKAVIRG